MLNTLSTEPATKDMLPLLSLRGMLNTLSTERKVEVVEPLNSLRGMLNTLSTEHLNLYKYAETLFARYAKYIIY